MIRICACISWKTANCLWKDASSSFSPPKVKKAVNWGMKESLAVWRISSLYSLYNTVWAFIHPQKDKRPTKGKFTYNLVWKKVRKKCWNGPEIGLDLD